MNIKLVKKNVINPLLLNYVFLARLTVFIGAIGL